MNLRDQIKGVSQDSPPVDEPSNSPEPAEDKVGDGKDKDGSRTLENVRGELLRKQEKLQSEINKQFSDLNARLTDLARGMVRPAAEKPKSQASLDDYTVSELEQYRGTISDADKPKLDAYIADRKTREAVKHEMESFTKQQQLDQSRVQYNKTAVDRYPDLNKETSDFAREVDRRLQELPEDIVMRNPRVVLDIANDVAIDRGVKPTQRRTVEGLSRVAPSNSSPTEQPTYTSKLTDDERDRIESKLQSALPKGKKFDRKKIIEREKFYDEVIDEHIQR